MTRRCLSLARATADGERRGQRVRKPIRPTFLASLKNEASWDGQGGEPLPIDMRARMEAAFGHDFRRVRVHADRAGEETARSHGALAVTLGDHIALGNGAVLDGGALDDSVIAHELTHVIQHERGRPGDRHDEAAIEAEASAASILATQGQFTHVTGRADSVPLRQATPTARSVQPVAPSARQQPVIEAARRAAAVRTQLALFRLSGIAPPSPSGSMDAAIEAQMRAKALAQVMFEWDEPNMEQITEVVSSMVNSLTSRTSVMVAGRADPECGNREAYVRGHRPPIVLCRAFFRSGPEQQTRTMIHEAAHLARIGSGALGESYCVDFDCTTSCGGFESADSWAHFVHCLSGQQPDQPIQIRGRAGGGRRQGGRP
jgi:hypothetical protein